MTERQKIGKIKQPTWHSSPIQKPNNDALWYGLNDSWIFLNTLSTGCRCGFKRYLHQLVLDETQVCRISNMEEFNAFTNEFGDAAFNGRLDQLFSNMNRASELRQDLFDTLKRNQINWSKVSEKYGAVEIYPYLDAARDTWFWAWECASGCILNPGVVKELRPFARYDSKIQQYVRV